MKPESTAQKSLATLSRPRLGVVLLDSGHYTGPTGAYGPNHLTGLGRLPRGFFECPATWTVSTAFAVAPGASALAVQAATPEALAGLRVALGRLPDSCELIVTDCGFFFAARTAGVPLPKAALLSALDLLDICAILTNKDVGVLTYSRPKLERVISGHPVRSRCQIVGVSEIDAWKVLQDDDFARRGRWSLDDLRATVLSAVRHEFATAAFQSIGVMLIECTVMCQFAELIQEVISVPVVDVRRFAESVLSGDSPTTLSAFSLMAPGWSELHGHGLLRPNRANYSPSMIG